MCVSAQLNQIGKLSTLKHKFANCSLRVKLKQVNHSFSDSATGSLGQQFERFEMRIGFFYRQLAIFAPALSRRLIPGSHRSIAPGRFPLRSFDFEIASSPGNRPQRPAESTPVGASSLAGRRPCSTDFPLESCGLDCFDLSTAISLPKSPLPVHLLISGSTFR